MHRKALVILVGATLVLPVVTLAWTALGPGIAKACPAPGLRPIGNEWHVAESQIGSMNGPGDVWGSLVAWERPASPTAPRRRLTIILSDAIEGDRGDDRTIRGRPGYTFGFDWPEPGSVDVGWDSGGLGCSEYEVYASGDGITEAEAIQEVEDLR